MSGRNGGKLGIRAMAAMRRFRICLEGHLDEAGAGQGKTGKELLAELAATRTVAELTDEINWIIDPFETLPQSVSYLLDRYNITPKSPGEGEPWGDKKKEEVKR